MHTYAVRVRVKRLATVVWGPKAGCVRRDRNVQ